MKTHGTAVWQGGIKDGKGQSRVTKRALGGGCAVLQTAVEFVLLLKSPPDG